MATLIVIVGCYYGYNASRRSGRRGHGDREVDGAEHRARSTSSAWWARRSSGARTRERRSADDRPGPPPVALPRTAPAGGEAAAARALRAQVAWLERELSDLGLLDLAAHRPTAPHGGGRIGRAPLARPARGAERRARGPPGRIPPAVADERLELEEGNRRLREEMLADPAGHRWVRVSNRDIGEPGCHDWHVRPRFGLLGVLASWWRVVVSSGCPLQPAGCLSLD